MTEPISVSLECENGKAADYRDGRGPILSNSTTDQAAPQDAAAQARAARERGEQRAATHRADLIRRLFAVAISVGFASQLTHMDWLSGGSFKFKDAEELARLVTALFIAVMGWEWYDRDTERYPLNYIPRLILDVAIVFLYMLFLFSSANTGALWYCFLILIFVFYLLWDFVIILEPEKTTGTRYARVRAVQIDAAWALYFLLIAGGSAWWAGKRGWQVFVTCAFIIVGVIAVREDGKRATSDQTRRYGFGSWYRWIGIGAAVLIFYLYINLAPL